MDKSVIAGIVGTLVGIIAKSIFDFFTNRYNEKLKFKIGIKREQINIMVKTLALLFQSTKVQVQEFEHSRHQAFWHLSDDEFAANVKEVLQRSKKIIEYKEICTNASYYIPNGPLVRRHLDRVVEIVDIDVPVYFKSNIYWRANKENELLNELNELRELINRDIACEI